MTNTALPVRRDHWRAQLCRFHYWQWPTAEPVRLGRTACERVRVAVLRLRRLPKRQGLPMTTALRHCRESHLWCRPRSWQGLRLAVAYHREGFWALMPSHDGRTRATLLSPDEMDEPWDVLEPREVLAERRT